MSQKPRVFVSYSSGDLDLVRALHEELADAGFAIWRDERRVEQDWSREIAFALANKTDVVLLVWSRAAAGSQWVRNEWLTARALEKPIVPLVLDNAPSLPEPLSNAAPVRKCCSTREAGHFEAVVERLNGLSSFRQRYDYTILPDNCYIPFIPNPAFVGRSADLLELYLKMIGNLNKIGLNQVGTVGMGGVGKTQLAIEFVYRYAFAFNGIFWIQAADDWSSALVTIARDRLNLTIADPGGPEANRRYLYALQKYCKGNPRTLIVLDNVDDPRALNSNRRLLDPGLTMLSLGCDLLFTTRQKVKLPGVVLQSVDVLHPDVAFELLTANRKPDPDEHEHVRAIANAVGYLPLALVIIAAYLGNRPHVAWSDYLDDVRRRGLGALDVQKVTSEELATRHEAAVRLTLDSQWASIQDPVAQLLFELAALFPESAIVPKARLRVLAGMPLPSDPIEDSCEEALLLLSHWSLLEIVGEHREAVRLHPLMRHFARDLISNLGYDSFVRTAVQRVRDAYDDPVVLHSLFRSRGIEELIRDIAFAVALGSEDALANDLSQVLRLLQRERHHAHVLHARAPERFLPQLHHRAQAMGLTRRADALIAPGVRAGLRHEYRTLWVNPSQDPGWIRKLKGHRNSVKGLGFIKGTALAASTGWDANLVIWNIETGDAERTLEGHKKTAECLSVSNDGRHAATGSDDGTVIVWDLPARKAIRCLGPADDYVLQVYLSDDARHAVGYSRIGELSVWDVGSGQLRNRIDLFGDKELLSVSRDCRLAVVADREHTWVHDLAGDLRVHHMEGRAVAAAFAPDDRGVLIAGHGLLASWDLASGAIATRLQDERAKGIRIVEPMGRSRVLLGHSDATITLWDVGDGRFLRRFHGHRDSVVALRGSHDGTRALSAGTRETDIFLWDLDDRSGYLRPEGHRDRVLSVALLGEEAVSTDGREVITWDAKSGAIRCRSALEHDYGSHAAIAPGTRLLYQTSSRQGVFGISAFDIDSGRLVKTVADEVAVFALCVDPSGRTLVTAMGNRLTLWDLATEARKTIGLPGSGLLISAAEGGRYVLVGSDAGRVFLCDTEQRREVNTFDAEDSLNAVALDPHARYAATATFDTHELKVWDARTGECLYALLTDRRVNALALDDDRLIFGDDTGAVHLLELLR